MSDIKERAMWTNNLKVFFRNLFIGLFFFNYMKNEDLEPGGHENDRKNTTLLRTGNTERYINNSVLYIRWKAFGHPGFPPDDISDSLKLFCNRRSSSKS